MPDATTLWDLLDAHRVAIEDFAAAVDACLADPTTRVHPIGPAYVLDLAAAIALHPRARATLAGADIDPVERRAAVRAALLMARPTGR